MTDFAHWWMEDFDRSYAKARRSFRIEAPEYFNFGRDVVDKHAVDPSRVALLHVRAGALARRVTYAELAQASDQIASGIRSLKLLEPGDRVCVLAGVTPEWHEIILGCIKGGFVAVPGTTLLTSHDIEYRVNSSGARAIIAAPEHREKIEAIAERCPSLEHLVVIGERQGRWVSLADVKSQGETADGSPHRTRSVDPMMIYFTSGTTSLPKMVVRDHKYALAHLVTALFWMDLQPADIHWTISDTGWAKAAWGTLFSPMLVGAAVVLFDDEFSPEAALSLVDELQITSFCAPPTAYRMFSQIDLSAYALGSLRRCVSAGEPLNPEAIRDWRQATGLTIADGYGQTETVCLVGNHPQFQSKAGSMGRPLPGLDVDVVNDQGDRLAADEIGHLAVRLDDPWPPGLFHGYLTERGLDTRAFRNGWYYTGDTGWRDAEGYFWFVGREDDLITSAGYRISPFEVESVLLEHPAVAESAVVGAPDEVRGEIVAAHVVLADGYHPSDELVAELQAFCKRRTAPYKYPRQLIFVSQLPKTTSGKVRRKELRDAMRVLAVPS